MPQELKEYILCKEFGWTPSQLRMQANSDISNFLAIMGIERKEMKRQIDKQNARAKN